jgi:hypothetical protein
MRHFLVILLLLLMPLQTVWGSVNSYCQHEESAEADHFGHHKHDHAEAGDAGDDDGIGRTVDADCDYCHHACSNLMSIPARTDHFPCRLAPPQADETLYLSFIADVTHPPDI